MATFDELVNAITRLTEFNPNHASDTGEFSSGSGGGGGGSSGSKTKSTPSISDKKSIKIQPEKIKTWQDIQQHLDSAGLTWNPEGGGFLPSTSNNRIEFPDKTQHYFKSFKDFKERVVVPLSENKPVDMRHFRAEKKGSIIGISDPSQMDTIKRDWYKKNGYEIKVSGKIYQPEEFKK